MGRIYKPVKIIFNKKEYATVAIVDTGADESVITVNAAHKVNAKPTGKFVAVSASQTVIEGFYVKIVVVDIATKQKIELSAGVSDTPFKSDIFDEEGVDVILGVDYIQKAGLKLGDSR